MCKSYIYIFQNWNVSKNLIQLHREKTKAQKWQSRSHQIISKANAMYFSFLVLSSKLCKRHVILSHTKCSKCGSLLFTCHQIHETWMSQSGLHNERKMWRMWKGSREESKGNQKISWEKSIKAEKTQLVRRKPKKDFAHSRHLMAWNCIQWGKLIEQGWETFPQSLNQKNLKARAYSSPHPLQKDIQNIFPIT